GGLINVASEWKGYDPVAARAKTMRIRETIADIAYRSRDSGRRPEEIADRMVADILARAGSQPLVSTSSIPARPAATRARDTALYERRAERATAGPTAPPAASRPPAPASLSSTSSALSRQYRPRSTNT